MASSRVRVAAEVALVFLGILAAFSLESWWAQRAEHAREIIYLRGLEAEFQATEIVLEDLIASHRLESIQFEELNRLLDSGEPTADSIISLSRVLWTVSVYAPRMPTYENLLGTEGMALLQSESLREGLRKYESLVAYNRGWDDYLVDFDQDVSVSVLATRLPFYSIIFGGESGRNVPRPDPIQLASDIQFRNLIAIRAQGAADLIERRTELLEAVREVRRRLGAELED